MPYDDIFDEFDIPSTPSSGGLAARSSSSAASAKRSPGSRSARKRPPSSRQSSAMSQIPSMPDQRDIYSNADVFDEFDEFNDFDMQASPVEPSRKDKKAIKRQKKQQKKQQRSAGRDASASNEKSAKREKGARQGLRINLGARKKTDAIEDEMDEFDPNMQMSIIERIRDYFHGRSPRKILFDILEWIALHPYVIMLVSVCFIIIGLMFGRYYSFGMAIGLAFLGALLSKEDFDTASYVCYGCAFLDFFIPYLF